MLLVFHMPPTEAWTLQDRWWCAVVLAADSLSPVSSEVDLLQIGLLVPEHPTDAWSYWDLRNWTLNWHPRECLDTEISSRTLLRSSHSLYWLAFFPQCILVPSLPKGNSIHMPGHQCDVKENRTHGTRQPSSIAPVSSSVVFMPIVCTFKGGQGLKLALWHSPVPCAMVGAWS